MLLRIIRKPRAVAVGSHGRRLPGALTALAALLSAAACGDTTSQTPDPTPVLQAYASHLAELYAAAVTDAQDLQTHVDTFLASPSDTTLTAARQAWIDARAHYMLTEGARFYDGPIDVDPPNHEAALNAWPLDEAYVDYTTDGEGHVDKNTGLVNRPDLLSDITVTAIDALNAQGGDENISNGYHAVEFLLWGQALKTVGPGERPFTDYTTLANADRRASYLRAVVRGIIAHLTAVADAWAAGADYRSQFESGGMSSVALAFTGLGKMSKGELAGQRMNAPYASKSRRDQHDCFSSLTLIDYTRDAQGLLELYGHAEDGTPTLSSLVHATDAELDAQLQAQLQGSVDAMSAIPAPFEASIVGDDAASGRQAILKTITSLRKQGDLFAAAAAALGEQIVVSDEAD